MRSIGMWRRFMSSMIVDAHQQHHQPDAFTFRRVELSNFDWVFGVAPCYPVEANKVRIISEPREFYDALAERCAKARRRIVLSSLYLGTGDLERRLVDVVDDNLRTSAAADLRVDVLLDFQRGSRGVANSKTVLAPLLLNHGDRCRVSLYHTPQLRGLYKRALPERWNELIELQHMKVYLVDDTVIISGANLSNDYFTNRQDRYVLIENAALADFYADLVSSVQSISFQLKSDGSVAMDAGCPNPHTGNKDEFIGNARNRIGDVYRTAMEKQQDKGQSHIDSSDTWVIPLVQAGRLNIRMDSETTNRFINSLPSSSLIRIATGYFNLTSEYIETLTNHCRADCTLLMAHPNANGFKGAKGPAGGVPDAYSLLAQKFHAYIEAFGQEKRFRLYEYERQGWTYHGKGLWYYPPNDSLPSLTFIGSPNFGERSVNRDIETQIALITTNEMLRKKLHRECLMLHEYSKESKPELFQRKIPRWVKMTVGLFRNFF